MNFKVQLDDKKVYREIDIEAADYKAAIAMVEADYPEMKIVWLTDSDGVYFYKDLDWDNLDGVYEYYYSQFNKVGDEIDDLTDQITQMQHEIRMLHARRIIVGRQLYHLREHKARKELEDHAEARGACGTIARGE